jgi:hypothetical protein
MLGGRPLHWRVWVGALAISLICALVTVSLLRASNSTLTFYFFMSLLIAFVIPYAFLPFEEAIRAG